jgi:hypothetical protein
MLSITVVKGDSSKRCSASRFFHESVSHGPLSMPSGPFQIFSKIRGDIRSSRRTTGVIDTSGKCKKSLIRKVLIILFGHPLVVEFHMDNFLPSIPLHCVSSLILLPLFVTSVVDTNGKFSTGINNTSVIGGKICPRCC